MGVIHGEAFGSPHVHVVGAENASVVGHPVNPPVADPLVPVPPVAADDPPVDLVPPVCARVAPPAVNETPVPVTPPVAIADVPPIEVFPPVMVAVAPLDAVAPPLVIGAPPVDVVSTADEPPVAPPDEVIPLVAEKPPLLVAPPTAE
jgi:hypothetical protein